jgi:hypothetical protein
MNALGNKTLDFQGEVTVMTFIGGWAADNLTGITRQLISIPDCNA